MRVVVVVKTVYVFSAGRRLAYARNILVRPGAEPFAVMPRAPRLLLSAGNPSTGGGEGASLVLSDRFDIIGRDGGLVKGMDYASYADFSDAPTEGSLAADIFGKALFCLFAVAVVALCLFTFGAGAVVVAAVAACGTAAVIGTAVADGMDGQSRPLGAYLANAMAGCAIGAMAGMLLVALTSVSTIAGFAAALNMTLGIESGLALSLANLGAYGLSALTALFAINDAASVGYGQNVAIEVMFDGSPEALQWYNNAEMAILIFDAVYLEVGRAYAPLAQNKNRPKLNATTGADWSGKTKELATTAPMKIPNNATVNAQTKAAGYDQISYKWSDGTYKYEARWHTRTPGAPSGQGNTWVIERTTPGTASGQRTATHILTGPNQWTTRSDWQQAITANQNGIATDVQKALLQDGHWSAP